MYVNVCTPSCSKSLFFNRVGPKLLQLEISAAGRDLGFDVFEGRIYTRICSGFQIRPRMCVGAGISMWKTAVENGSDILKNG
jgi:hypothetical protein